MHEEMAIWHLWCFFFVHFGWMLDEDFSATAGKSSHNAVKTAQTMSWRALLTLPSGQSWQWIATGAWRKHNFAFAMFFQCRFWLNWSFRAGEMSKSTCKNKKKQLKQVICEKLWKRFQLFSMSVQTIEKLPQKRFENCFGNRRWQNCLKVASRIARESAAIPRIARAIWFWFQPLSNTTCLLCQNDNKENLFIKETKIELKFCLSRAWRLLHSVFLGMNIWCVVNVFVQHVQKLKGALQHSKTVCINQAWCVLCFIVCWFQLSLSGVLQNVQTEPKIDMLKQNMQAVCCNLNTEWKIKSLLFWTSKSCWTWQCETTWTKLLWLA